MNRKRHQVGENDVPLPLWGDEPAGSVGLAERVTPALNEHGALEGLVEVPRGASVSLGERAVALANIMGYYNQANRTKGANASPGKLQKQYGERGSYEVITNMKAKTSDLSYPAKRGFATLTAYDDMLKAGFSPEDIVVERDNIEKTMNAQYGPGNAYSGDREKLVRRANKAAGIRSKK